MKRSLSNSLAGAAAVWAAVLLPGPANAQTTGHVGSTGKIYEPLDTPAARTSADLADPFRDEMRRMQAEMDQLFSAPPGTPGVFPPVPRVGSLYDLPDAGGFSYSVGGTQRLALREEPGRYVAELSLPKGAVENLQVKVEGNVLRVSGTRTEKTERTEAGRRSRSLFSSSFQKSLILPGPVKAEKLKVDQSDTRVLITIPKS